MENNSGIGITGILGIIFIVLKLCGVIEWSWLWTLSPIWTDKVWYGLPIDEIVEVMQIK